MPVYVDDMRAPFRGMVMCHMVADTDEELHEMAGKLGLSRRWHQFCQVDAPGVVWCEVLDSDLDSFEMSAAPAEGS